MSDVSSDNGPWYKDPTNPLVVNHEHGDFAATALVYGAELTDLRAEAGRLRKGIERLLERNQTGLVAASALRELLDA